MVEQFKGRRSSHMMVIQGWRRMWRAAVVRGPINVT
jgi:hypothetical protein